MPVSHRQALDLEKLAVSPRVGYSILVGPDLPAASPALKAIMDAPNLDATMMWLVNALDPRPPPCVLAASITVAVNIAFSLT
jgi:hypothetical protein